MQQRSARGAAPAELGARGGRLVLGSPARLAAAALLAQRGSSAQNRDLQSFLHSHGTLDQTLEYLQDTCRQLTPFLDPSGQGASRQRDFAILRREIESNAARRPQLAAKQLAKLIADLDGLSATQANEGRSASTVCGSHGRGGGIVQRAPCLRVVGSVRSAIAVAAASDGKDTNAACPAGPGRIATRTASGRSVGRYAGARACEASPQRSGRNLEIGARCTVRRAEDRHDLRGS